MVKRRIRRHVDMYIQTYEIQGGDIYGYIEDAPPNIYGEKQTRSMYTDSRPVKPDISDNTLPNETNNDLEQQYREAAARLAPFLPIQLRTPSIPKPKDRQTRRRDWWATQKRRRYWRKNPTRKAVAYRRRRTFRGQQ